MGQEVNLDKINDSLINIEGSVIPSFVCLFWLSDDGFTVIKVAGEVEFHNHDIKAKKAIEPKGMHEDYVKDSYNYNRGRICLINGKVDLTIGKSISDDAISYIKNNFGISKFDVNIYRTGLYDK